MWGWGRVGLGMCGAGVPLPHGAAARRELSLRRGDVVLLHGAVDANWLRGEHGGRVGIFPRTYVEVTGVTRVLGGGAHVLGCRPPAPPPPFP